MTARNGWLAALERLSVKPSGASKVPVMSKKDDGKPLPSLRGPRSPKGKNGGMTEEQDRVRRLERQRAKRQQAKAAIPTEHAEQVAVCQWWAVYAAAHRLDVRLLMAIPNAQKFMSLAKNMHAALATVRAEGFRDGAPDLLLAVPRLILCGHLNVAGSVKWPQTVRQGLFIEMKRLDGKLSADQHSFGMLLQSQGYAWVMAKGADQAIAAIGAYLGTANSSQNVREGTQASI